MLGVVWVPEFLMFWVTLLEAIGSIVVNSVRVALPGVPLSMPLSRAKVALGPTAITAGPPAPKLRSPPTIRVQMPSTSILPTRSRSGRR